MLCNSCQYEYFLTGQKETELTFLDCKVHAILCVSYIVVHFHNLVGMCVYMNSVFMGLKGIAIYTIIFS